MKELNLLKISKPKAFLGKTTTKVRKIAVKLALEYKGNILDVGCGNCLLFLELLSKYRFDHKILYGLDIKYDLLKEATDISKDNLLPLPNLINGDGTSLPFKNKSFNIIFCLNSFVNFNKDTIEKLLSEFSRVVKDDCIIIFDIRNKRNILLNIKYKISQLKIPLKIRTYSISELKPILNKYNFSIKKIINVRLTPFIIIDKIIILKKETVK